MAQRGRSVLSDLAVPSHWHRSPCLARAKAHRAPIEIARIDARERDFRALREGVVPPHGDLRAEELEAIVSHDRLDFREELELVGGVLLEALSQPHEDERWIGQARDV